MTPPVRFFGDGTGVHMFDEDEDPPNDSESGDHFGIGDLLLRSKFNFFRSSRLYISGSLELRLPTGDPDNLTGIDDFGIKPLLIVSSSVPAFKGIISPHLNLGFEVNSGQNGQEEIDYSVGFDYGVLIGSDLVTATVDVIGSEETNKKDDVGDSIIDIALGFKWSFFKRNIVYSNFQFPLNDDGLRADIIFTFGYEIGF